jgi:hypothetical protein
MEITMRSSDNPKPCDYKTAVRKIVWLLKVKDSNPEASKPTRTDLCEIVGLIYDVNPHTIEQEVIAAQSTV